MLCHKQFKQRIVKSRYFWSYYKEVHNFCLDKHLFFHSQPYNHDTFQRKMAEMCIEQLDPSLPLWQFHIFQDVTFMDHGSEVNGAVAFLKFHHAIADGIAILKVIIGT